MAEGVGDFDRGWGYPDGNWDERLGGSLSAAERRVVELMAEFRRRQRRRPDLAVRPWWTARTEVGDGRVGFVVEYCPGGRDSVEVVVRVSWARVEGPRGVLEHELDLAAGWLLDGLDTGSPETLANHLLRLADRALEEEAA